MAVSQAWITLNRICNLRCQWCYARGTGFSSSDKMPPELVYQILLFLSQIGVRDVYFTGGEATLQTDLEKYISYADKLGLRCGLITNGIELSRRALVEVLENAGLDSVNLSIKGWSRESFIRNTGVDGFEKSLDALTNLSNSRLNFLTSFVLSCQNIEFLQTVTERALECGAGLLYFSFEHDFSPLDGIRAQEHSKNLAGMFEMIRKFEAGYETLNRLTNGNFILHQSLPLCAWDRNFIHLMVKRNQISLNCQMRERSGLVFSTDGSLILCNLLYQVVLGRFGETFRDKHSFESFWNSEEVCSIYATLSALPSARCDACEFRYQCGGGCLANWLHYDYDEFSRQLDRQNQHS